jgi:hypothetical protein
MLVLLPCRGEHQANQEGLGAGVSFCPKHRDSSAIHAVIRDIRWAAETGLFLHARTLIENLA